MGGQPEISLHPIDFLPLKCASMHSTFYYKRRHHYTFHYSDVPVCFVGFQFAPQDSFSEYPTYKLFWVGWTILGTILGTIVGQLDIHVSKGPLLCTTCTTASPMKWTVALGSKMDYSGGQVDLPKPLWTKSDKEVATNFIFLKLCTVNSNCLKFKIKIENVLYQYQCNMLRWAPAL